jgi:hypothetical protein
LALDRLGNVDARRKFSPFGFAPRRVHVLERDEVRDMRGREETLLTIVVLVHFRAWP